MHIADCSIRSLLIDISTALLEFTNYQRAIKRGMTFIAWVKTFEVAKEMAIIMLMLNYYYWQIIINTIAVILTPFQISCV